MNTMQLSDIQRGVTLSADNPMNIKLPQFSVYGATALSVNLRHGADGALEGLRRETDGVTMTRSVIATDRRVSGTNLLSVWDNDGKLYLYLEGVYTPDGEYESLESMICALPAAVAECSSVGEFLVLRLEDKRLFFLLWESATREYSSMGLLPSLPEVTIRRVEQPDIEVTVAAQEFKDTVADLRGGVPTAVTSQVGGAVVAAWQEGVARAHAKGAFVQPVVARVGLRLWDGSLYYLSDPIEIPDMSYVGATAINMQLVKDSEGYSGTAATNLYVPNYQLSVRVERGVENDWSSVVRGIELYISTEQEILSGTVGAVYYVSTSDTLRCTLPINDSTLLAASLADQPMLLTTRYSAITVGAYTLPWRSGTAAVMTTVTPPDGSAQHICSHGGFLHLLSDKTLTTMLRGNPFVVASATVLGEDVTAMMAQPCGGGAYTRQYLYLFGESGVYALTHDFYGNHVNCRRISPLTLVGDDAIAVADDGVWIISHEGVLALLKDSKVQVRMRGLTMACRLAWHRALNELWVMADTWPVALVLQDDGNAYLRTLMSPQWVSRHGELLYLRTVVDKTSPERYVTQLFRVAHEAPASGNECDLALLTMRDLPLPEDGRVTAVISLYGQQVSADVEITLTAPLTPSYERTVKGSISGNILMERIIPLTAPRLKQLRHDAQALAEVSISGRFPLLKYVKLESIDK
jgi:hypothetical protein